MRQRARPKYRITRAQREAIAAARAERRMAAPAPSYADYAPGAFALRVLIEGIGWAHEIVGYVPPSPGARRARSDQYAATEDGRPWATVGLVALFDRARALVPRRLSRRELHTLGR